MIDWGNILEKVLVAVIPVLVALVAGWLKIKWEQFKNGQNQDAMWALTEAVRIAVAAAEQSGLAKLISDTAESKKAFAIDFAERWLARAGIDMDLDLIVDAIEAEVGEQFPHTEPVHSLPIDVGL